MKLEFSFECVLDTAEAIADMRKKLHVLAETFLTAVKQTGEYEDYEPGVHIELYNLDGGEVDELDFYGVNIMKKYSEWKVTFTVRNKPGIKLRVVDHLGVQYLVIRANDKVLVEGYAEDVLKAIRQRSDEEWRKVAPDRVAIAYHHINLDMTDLNNALSFKD